MFGNLGCPLVLKTEAKDLIRSFLYKPGKCRLWASLQGDLDGGMKHWFQYLYIFLFLSEQSYWLMGSLCPAMKVDAWITAYWELKDGAKKRSQQSLCEHRLTLLVAEEIPCSQSAQRPCLLPFRVGRGVTSHTGWKREPRCRSACMQYLNLSSHLKLCHYLLSQKYWCPGSLSLWLCVWREGEVAGFQCK